MTSAVGSSTSTSSTSSSSSTSKIGEAAGLGKDDFMQLLIAQLKNQDPMKPTDDTQFIAQLAQFSSLEATNKMSDTLAELSNAQMLGQAAAMIGKTVSAKLTDGTTVTGTVTQVNMVDSKAKVVVNGQEIDSSLITSVTNTASSSTSTSTTSTSTTSTSTTEKATTTNAATTAAASNSAAATSATKTGS
jgi:flagellar basal-body rod modification protein FlgD